MVEPTPMPTGVNVFRHPMPPNIISRPVRRNLGMNVTVNGLSNFCFAPNMTYRQYPPREFVQMTQVQSRNIFLEENQIRNYPFNPENSNNNGKQRL